MKTVTIKAIIFDGSGTFLNDLCAVWQATADAYAALGINGMVTLEDFKEKIKLPISRFHLENGVPSDLIHEVDMKFRESYPQYEHCVEIFPEVIGVFQELKRREIILGVASNIPTVFLWDHLRNFDIDEYFDVVTGQEDCDEQKPSPKPVICTVEKMDVRPQEVMFVGDMEEDIIAGKRANVVTTAIIRDESYHPRWRLERQEPDFFISDLTELLLMLG